MSGPVTPIEEPDNSPDIQNPAAYLPPQDMREVQGVSAKSSKKNLSTEALSTGALQSAKGSLMHVLNTVESLQGTSTVQENPQIPVAGFSGNTTNVEREASSNLRKIDYSMVVHPTETGWVEQAQQALQSAETALHDLKTTTDESQLEVLLSNITAANNIIQQAEQNASGDPTVAAAVKRMEVIIPEANTIVTNVTAAQNALIQANTAFTKLNTSTSLSEIESLVEEIQAAAAAAQKTAQSSGNQPIAQKAAEEATAVAAQAKATATAIKTAHDAAIAAQKDLDAAQKTTSPEVLSALLADAQKQNTIAQTAAESVPQNTLARTAAESTSQIVQQIQSLVNALSDIVNTAINTGSSEGAANISSSERGYSQILGGLLSLSASSQYTTMINGLRQMLNVFEINNPSLMDLSGVMKRLITNTTFIRSNRSVKSEVNALLNKIIDKITKAKNLSIKDKTSLTSIILPALASISGANTLSVVHFNSVFTNITKFLSSLSTGNISSTSLIEFTENVKTLNHLYPSLNNSGRLLVDSTMSDILKTNLVAPETLSQAILKNQNLSRQKEVLALSSSLGGFFGVMNALEKLSIITNQGSQLTLSGAQEKLRSVLQKGAGAPPPVYMATPMDASASFVSKLTNAFVENTKMTDSLQRQRFLLSPSFTHSFVFNVASLIPKR